LGFLFTMHINDIPINDLIQNTAEELKKIESIKAPAWGSFVKTGMHKERQPLDKDWWYMRAAAVLRKIMLLGPIGVAKLRVHYGGKKNRGARPERFYAGSGSIARKVLQQLEQAALVKQVGKDEKRKGRIITPKGHKLLDSIALRGTHGSNKTPSTEKKTD
jgi:small subunit ribosomal protein S19e